MSVQHLAERMVDVVEVHKKKHPAARAHAHERISRTTAL
jgi:hypothetical protein